MNSEGMLLWCPVSVDANLDAHGVTQQNGNKIDPHDCTCRPVKDVHLYLRQCSPIMLQKAQWSQACTGVACTPLQAQLPGVSVAGAVVNGTCTLQPGSLHDTARGSLHTEIHEYSCCPPLRTDRLLIYAWPLERKSGRLS